MFFSRFALPNTGYLVVVSLLAGCAGDTGTVRILLPKTIIQYVRAAPSIPQVSLAGLNGGTVKVRVWVVGSSSQVKSTARVFQVDLLPNQPGDGHQNEAGVPAFKQVPGQGHNDYSSPRALASYEMPADTTYWTVHFTNVPIGIYRARLIAVDGDGGNISWPNPAFGPPGRDQGSVSLNAASVISGDATVYRNVAPNGGSEESLDVSVQPLSGEKPSSKPESSLVGGDQ